MRRKAKPVAPEDRPPGLYPPGPVAIPDEATMQRRLAEWESSAPAGAWGRACGDVAHEPRQGGKAGAA